MTRRMQAMAAAHTASASQQTPRNRRELAVLLGGLELGVVDVARWPTGNTTTVAGGLAAVAVAPNQ